MNVARKTVQGLSQGVKSAQARARLHVGKVGSADYHRAKYNAVKKAHKNYSRLDSGVFVVEKGELTDLKREHEEEDIHSELTESVHEEETSLFLK